MDITTLILRYVNDTTFNITLITTSVVLPRPMLKLRLTAVGERRESLQLNTSGDWFPRGWLISRRLFPITGIELATSCFLCGAVCKEYRMNIGAKNEWLAQTETVLSRWGGPWPEPGGNRGDRVIVSEPAKVVNYGGKGAQNTPNQHFWE